MPHVTQKEQRANLLEVAYLFTCAHPNIVQFLQGYLIRDEIWV